MQVYTNVSAPDRKFILILSELSICLLYFRPHAVPHCAVDDDVVADSSYLIQRLQTADATHVHHQDAAAKA